ncbi:conserved exported hypothetical protein [Magnetospirillum sp. LM-5]|uniref:hypothetical protein n=1 Tax=Magnetospirillum sp. LM-5 TaxID=2681466 RepID=UPI001382A836|nr:hypothetical protein [Magnetospirillum sp. LM-5]CAA7614424.1 conserved exported hypothetical protein [Magnetospirillum sp. LM-5]
MIRALAVISMAWASAAYGQDVSAVPPLSSDWHADIRATTDANRWAGLEADDPLAAPMLLCRSPGCPSTVEVRLDPDAIQSVRAHFDPVPINAPDERARIGGAIAHLERLVAPTLGTWNDQPANNHQDWDLTGQLDCVAETVNTLTYLDRLALAGLILRHDVSHEVIRFTLILQHIAVEIIEIDTNDSWVVDSWPGANGEEPLIQPYGEWRGEWQV